MPAVMSAGFFGFSQKKFGFVILNDRRELKDLPCGAVQVNWHQVESCLCNSALSHSTGDFSATLEMTNGLKCQSVVERS